MKQTNNAIKFLMAQYRAIFKSAYIKGLATAVVLTAGLAAGQASAAGTPNDTFWVLPGSNTWAEKNSGDDVQDGGITVVAGSYANKDTTGEKTANNNVITVGQNSGTAVIKSIAQTANIAGGYVKIDGSSGDATASGNNLTVLEKSLLGLSGGSVNGGYAAATSGAATAEGNILTIHSGSSFTGHVRLVGGTALSKTGATATNNKLSVTGVTLASGSIVVGGDAKIDQDNGTGKIESIGNSITFDKVTFSDATATALTKIVANQAETVTGKTGLKVSQVTANGSKDSSLTIKNSQLYAAQIWGGYAVNNGSGSASASDNTVLIQNTNISSAKSSNSSAVFGGAAIATGIDDTSPNAGATFDASNNQVTIESTNGQDYTVTGNVIGAHVNVKSASANSSATLSGSTLTANNNSIIIGKNVVVDGGKVHAAEILAVGSDGTTTKDKITATISASNNSVTINGEVNSGTIRAVKVDGGKGFFNNNDVTVNNKITNISEIIGGAGKDSEVLLSNKSTATYTGTTSSIVSDTVTLAGNMSLDSASNLTVKGYFTNGSHLYSTFNPNQTIIASSANIQNAGKITLFGETTVADGAKLHATAAGAAIIVNGDGGNKVVDDKLLGATDKQDDDNVMNTNGGFVGGKGSLAISEATLKSYLNYQNTADKYTPIGTTTSTSTDDKAGSVQLTSGGVLEFTDDSVVLSKYDFSNNPATAGTIALGTNATTDSAVIKGKTIVIEHALATNGSTAKKPFDTTANDLNTTGLDVSGTFIEADVLKLGSSQLTEDQSADIQFAKGTAKNEIDFTVASGDFQLTSMVAGNNYMRTQDQDKDLDYYTALNGTITGDVNIKDSGKLTIEYGNWTAKDSITVASGGTLTVGVGVADTDPELTPGKNGSLPDATLTLDQALTLDVSATGTATVEVNGDHANGYTWNGKGNNLYDFEEAADTIGDDHLVLLDLSKGLELQGDINGKADIKVENGGIIKLNASDLNDILAANNAAGVDKASGAFFSASSYGVFDVKGDVEAQFGDFVSTTNHGINLSNGGYLYADSLSVINNGTTPAVEDSGYKPQVLDLGANGHVSVKDLVISDLQQTTGDNKPAGAGDHASKVVFGKGNINIASSLTSNNHTLVLGSGSAANITLESALVADEGKVDVANIQVDSGSFTVLNGNWDATNTKFTLSGAGASMVIGGAGSDANDDAYAPALGASGLTMGAGSLLNVEANGSASFETADFSKLAAADAVSVAGTLIINGSDEAVLADGTTDDPSNGVKFSATEGSIQIEKNGILKFGSAATNGAILADSKYTGTDSIKLADGYSKIANNGGELHLGLNNTTNFDGDAIKALKSALFTSGSLSDGVLVSGGILNIGDATFNGINVDKLEGQGLSGYTATWDSLKHFSDVYGNDVTNDTLVQTNVSAVKVSDKVQGHWGSLSMDRSAASSAQVVLAGNTTLRFAAGNNGYLISNAAHNEARGAIVEDQKDLTLLGGGAIGKITLKEGSKDAEKNLTVLNVTGGDTTIAAIEGSQAGAGIANATLVDIHSNTTVTGDIKNIDKVRIVDGARVSAANAKINEFYNENSSTTIAGELNFVVGDVIGGKIQTKDAVINEPGSNDTAKLNIAHEGTFTAETLKANKSARINVGFDSANESYTLSDGSTKMSGTGYFDVGTLELDGATIVVDPAYGEKTSVGAALKFKKGKESYDFNDVGTLVGAVHVGANSVFAVGANVADTLDAISSYQTNGSLSKDKYGSILYLNGQLTVDNVSEIALNADDAVTSNIRDSLKYTIENTVLDQYATLGLGKNTAILMTEKAFEDQDGNKTGTAIYFNRKEAVVNGAGGDIVLAGDFDAAEKLNIFNDLDNNGVMVKGSIDVRTQNGFLYTTLSGDNQGMGVQLEIDKDHAYEIMNEASTPVVETLISYHVDRTGAVADGGDTNTGDGSTDLTPINPADSVDGKSALASTKSGAVIGDGNGSQTTTPEGGEGSDNGTTEKPVVPGTKVTGSSSFLNDVVNNTHGAPAEQAARLAVYGGAVQSAMTANSVVTDAIAARMGTGSGLTIAQNGQGAALWVAPLYKNSDADGFAAQGLEYGVDLNLYGLALGGDYTLSNGMTVGAMFNIGSGDADGQGNTAASGVSNDFDYFGFSVYGGYTFGNFSVVADAGYTRVDNDVEANVTMDTFSKLNASMDSTALTFGVTGKYAMTFNGIEVAPHAGLRFTSIDLDDYTVKADNTEVAAYDADKLNVFSIPVGVTIAREFQGEEWNVKPSFDLTVTGQFGDDEAEGTVSWKGVDGLKTNVSSEVFDSFTYGATVGVAAQTGNFSLGFGLNYTGSSNVDEFGVNANARFVF